MKFVFEVTVSILQNRKIKGNVVPTCSSESEFALQPIKAMELGINWPYILLEVRPEPEELFLSDLNVLRDGNFKLWVGAVVDRLQALPKLLKSAKAKDSLRFENFLYETHLQSTSFFST